MRCYVCLLQNKKVAKTVFFGLATFVLFNYFNERHIHRF